MVRECFKTNSGVIFKTDSLCEIGMDPYTIYPSVLPRPPALIEHAKMRVIEEPRSTSFLAWIGSFFFKSSEANGNATQVDVPKFPQLPEFTSEEDEELRDALSPTFDQLDINWFWWDSCQSLPDIRRTITSGYRKSCR